MEEVEVVPMTPEEVLAICKEDYASAKEAKEEINTKVAKWRDLYSGALLGNETDGRSKYVAKEAQNAVNWWIPNAKKPFLSSNDIVDFLPRTADDIQKAKSQNLLINYQFNNDFNKDAFLHSALHLFAVEGTSIARVGWEHKEETETIPFEGFNQQQLMELAQQGAELNIEDEFTRPLDAMEDPRLMATETVYKGTATITTTTVSRPEAKPVKLEDFFPLGETIEDGCIQRIDTNLSDLRKQDKKYSDRGIYENVDNLAIGERDEYESNLGQPRADDLDQLGKDQNMKLSDKSKQEVTIYEYYGCVDVNNDGIAEPIVCVWSGNTILRVDENPFPDKEPPFVAAPFQPEPFAFFGNGLPYFMEDIVKVRSAIMRTFIDMMANSTNGQKHIQKGALDALNARRLREAKIGSIVEWNDLNGYQPSPYNEVPASLQKMYELFGAEGENASGVTKYNQGLDSGSLNKTATGITAIMSQSQMRVWDAANRFSEQFMKPLFRKWIAYNKEYLDMDIAVRISQGEFMPVTKDDIKGNFDLIVNVGIAGSEESKAQKIIQMLQMVQPLVQAGALPPSHITKLIGELEELWGFKDLAQELKQMVEQSEMQQQQMAQGVPTNSPPIQ